MPPGGEWGMSLNAAKRSLFQIIFTYDGNRHLEEANTPACLAQ